MTNTVVITFKLISNIPSLTPPCNVKQKLLNDDKKIAYCLHSFYVQDYLTVKF